MNKQIIFSNIDLCFLILLTVLHIQNLLQLSSLIDLDWVLNALEILALIQNLFDLENSLTHVVIHVSLLGAVHLSALIHDHGSPGRETIRSQACLRNIGLRVVLILLNKRVDHVVLLDLLQVSIFARILDVHFHSGVVVHKR